MAEADSIASSVEHPKEGPNQKHLKEVHKDYRVIEQSRQNYHNESESIMRRQEALLQTLSNENRTLQEKVDSYMLPDVSREASQMQAEADKFSGMIESEAKKLQGLETALKESYAQLQTAKQSMGGVFAVREKHRMTVIRGAITENRLQKALVKLNIVRNKNKALKRKMDEVNEEREFYDKVKMNMERELQGIEKNMEDRKKGTREFYHERNDFEERITDIHEIATDMSAYNLWKETEGWAIMDPEPLAKVINPAEHPTGERGKPPHECSQRQRGWIELKALALIQDIFDINDCADVVNCVRKAQEHNNALFELVQQLLQTLNETDGKLQADQMKFDTSQSNKTVLINRKLDMESTLEAILDLLGELDLSDEELLPIIREMKKQLSAVFKEAGCNLDDVEDVDYEGQAQPTVRYQSGKSLPLEVAIVEFFVTIEHFVEQISGFKH